MLFSWLLVANVDQENQSNSTEFEWPSLLFAPASVCGCSLAGQKKRSGVSANICRQTSPERICDKQLASYTIIKGSLVAILPIYERSVRVEQRGEEKSRVVKRRVEQRREEQNSEEKRKVHSRKEESRQEREQ